MSRDNVELVRHGYELLARQGGLAVFAAELVIPEIEIDCSTIG
jgi:hypothetical protein